MIFLPESEKEVIENWFCTPIYFFVFKDKLLEEIQDEVKKCKDKLSSNDFCSPWNDSVKTTFDYKYKNDFLKGAPRVEKEIL